MDLAFPAGLVLTVLLAVLITGQVAGDGRSDWLKGVQLLAVYLVLGFTFFFMPNLRLIEGPRFPVCKRLALLLPLLLATCAAPLTWQKPGVDNTTLTKDTSDCRASAEREAVRRYPHGFVCSRRQRDGCCIAARRDQPVHRGSFLVQCVHGSQGLHTLVSRASGNKCLGP